MSFAYCFIEPQFTDHRVCMYMCVCVCVSEFSTNRKFLINEYSRDMITAFGGKSDQNKKRQKNSHGAETQNRMSPSPWRSPDKPSTFWDSAKVKPPLITGWSPGMVRMAQASVPWHRGLEILPWGTGSQGWGQTSPASCAEAVRASPELGQGEDFILRP